MPSKPILDYLVYGLVVLLSVVILIFVLLAPPDLTAIKNAYQGF